MTASPAPAPRPADLIAEYIWLRDNKKAEEARFKTFIQDNYSTRMKQIEYDLLGFLNVTGLKNSGDEDSGLVYRKTSVSVTIADPLTFQRHVIGTQDFSLLDWHANKTAIKEMMERGENPALIGLNYSQFDTVGIRKKGSRE